MTDFLSFVPEQGGYSVVHPVQVIAVELDGGAPRLRADRIRASGTIGATWMLDSVEYNQFRQFVIQNTLQGALPFLVDLVTDSFQLARHRCTIVPGSLRTSQVNGLTYRISASLRPEQLISTVVTPGFFAQSPNIIGTSAPVNLNAVLANPTTLQIVGFSLNDGVHPPIKLDGIYGISSFPTGSTVALSSPASINTDWNVLTSSYPAGPTANVANAMLINSPT